VQRKTSSVALFDNAKRNVVECAIEVESLGQEFYEAERTREQQFPLCKALTPLALQ
jgi:hypothetical protein